MARLLGVGGPGGVFPSSGIDGAGRGLGAAGRAQDRWERDVMLRAGGSAGLGPGMGAGDWRSGHVGSGSQGSNSRSNSSLVTLPDASPGFGGGHPRWRDGQYPGSAASVGGNQASGGRWEAASSSAPFDTKVPPKSGNPYIDNCLI